MNFDRPNVESGHQPLPVAVAGRPVATCCGEARDLARRIEELLADTVAETGPERYAVRLAQALTESLIAQLSVLSRPPVA